MGKVTYNTIFKYESEFINSDLEISWNGSSTFNVFNGKGKAIDCFTHYNIKTMAQAEQVADEHFQELEEEFKQEQAIDHADCWEPTFRSDY
tara:strand:+ start:412 stop:684 length:273 start_codon:yes stop_codon:yes gene_type:complete